jgi:hypothetical protein
VGVLFLLETLQQGSLILADLGYFSFAWFDDLTGPGCGWISRLKSKTSSTVLQILYEDPTEGVLEAIIFYSEAVRGGI